MHENISPLCSSRPMRAQYCRSSTNERAAIYLGLGQSQGGGQLGSLRQGEVLSPLEPQLQLLDLGAGVDRPGVANLGIEILEILLSNYEIVF